MPQLNYSQRCSAFVHQLTYSSIPEQAINQIKSYFFDLLGCIIQGHTHAYSQPAKNYLMMRGGNAQTSVIGETVPTTIFNAAFYHGYLGHILEMDDVDRESITHPATVIIPAALAVAEWQKKSGQDLLTAIVAGYEVMLAIGTAITPAHYKIWHTTATTGGFGSAMAVGKLLGLSPQQLDWALGNAGTMAAGLWQFLADGAMSKFLHTGRAAENGVLAAYLASQQFSGARQILEGEQGFFVGYAKQEIDARYFTLLGQGYRSKMVSIKPYPCCRHTHSAIDAANALRLQLASNKIEQLMVHTYQAALQVAGKSDPKTPQEAKFSLKFCIARSLLHGLVTEKDFTEQTIYDPETRQLMDSIEIVVAEDIEQRLPQEWPCRLVAQLINGQIVEIQINSPKGDPMNPLSWQELQAKFNIMTAGILSPIGQNKLAHLCANLETLDDISQIISMINKYWLK